MSDDDNLELHVTLKHPLSIKVMGEITWIKAFDGTTLGTHEGDFQWYRAVRLYNAPAKPISMKITLRVHTSSIVGYVSQPFDPRASGGSAGS